VISESISEKDFRKAVRKHLSLAPKTKITVVPLGYDSWKIRAGHTYAVMEARQMKITLHDAKGQKKTVQTTGDTSLGDLYDQLRRERNLAPWTRIIVERADQQPFWVEDKGNYAVVTQYDPDLDTRPIVEIRVHLLDRSFIVENYRVENDDPLAIWTDVRNKYGFAEVTTTQMTISGHPSTGRIEFKIEVAVSCLNVTLPHFVSRSFEILIADEPWKSGEVISPATHNRDQVWEQLQQLTPLPHISQFQFIQGRTDISTCLSFPPGEIIAIPYKSPVTWLIETFMGPVIQQGMTPLKDVEEAWQLLHHEVPRLFEKATFNYVGKLKPGQTIQAEVAREDIEATARFEIKDHGRISFEHATFSNMMPRPELHANFARIDPRIPPPMYATLTKTRDHIIPKPLSPSTLTKTLRRRTQQPTAVVQQEETTVTV
jgi:hypothetical protein